MTDDHLLYFANRIFWIVLRAWGGLGSEGKFIPGYGLTNCRASPELVAARYAVRETVEWFLRPILEGDADATPREFVRQLMLALERVQPIPREYRERLAVELAAQPGMELPFDRDMARPVAEWTEGAEQMVVMDRDKLPSRKARAA